MAVHEPMEERVREPRVEVTPTEARQGRTGRPVLMVLIGGLILAMVAWAGAEFFGMAIAPNDDTGGGERISAPAADTTTGTPTGDTIDNNPPANDQRQTAPATIDQQPTSNQ